MNTQTIPADQVREGDTLVDLDNGYVYEDAEIDPNVSFSDGRYSFDAGRGMVLISFHGAEGDENYLLVTPDHPIKVGR